jgi:APA family basic amino acid/polyamine antiporter
MARDGYLPRPLTIIRRDTPVGAELVVGAVVAGLAATLDLRNAIGFSSFGVLLYYAIANASAWSLGRARVIPTVGLIGCVALAADLPGRDVLAGLAVTALGIAVFAATTRLRHPVNL